MRRAVLGGIAATLLFAVTACGGDDAPKGDSKATSSSTPPDDVDPDEVAGIVTDTPTDVRWQMPQAPPSWKRAQVGAGEAQWQVSSTCVITLFQPAGVGKETEPTQEQILDKYAKQTSQAIGTALDVSDRDSSMFPLVTKAEDVTAKAKVAQAKLTGGNGVEGEIYAYRSGDFALVLITSCGQDTFADVDASDFQPFIGKLAITAEY